ncbi:MAG: hypothetical protein LBS57_07755 [Treponema sp.]|jgi:hypothetical protein|nr:hypothetical protein [Treponema sp.]
MIVIFSAKKAAALGLGKNLLARVSLLPPEKLAKYTPQKGDVLYLDISGMERGALRKALGVLKKAAAPWGVMDPGGNAADPAEFFFEGAFDYLGPRLIKEGLKEKRLAAALSRKLPGGQKEGAKKTWGEPAAEEGLPLLRGVKLPPGKFPPWSSLKAGTTAPFFFLFVSAEGGKGDLRGALGEAAFTGLRNRLRLFLQRRFEPSGALLWMETESNTLLLIPPRASLIKEALVSSLKILMAAPAIGLEILGLSFPVRFTFALHYGKTVYHRPGGTGTVVSDAVNFIFHLGTRRAEAGRLTVSGETPAEVIPKGLEDMFVRAGEFEGRSLVHSRRFFIRTESAQNLSCGI